jgi:hypothetical protein
MTDLLSNVKEAAWPPPGFNLRTFQSVASRYTDCAVPANSVGSLDICPNRYGVCLLSKTVITCIPRDVPTDKTLGVEPSHNLEQTERNVYRFAHAHSSTLTVIPYAKFAVFFLLRTV